mmetsp:Transcript_8669/g.10696  ORF Transcript_8669/g.10696 Transcript_8669/m.10696 type:complete len:120 (-) Transcript_8669:2511-2870(-)
MEEAVYARGILDGSIPQDPFAKSSYTVIDSKAPGNAVGVGGNKLNIEVKTEDDLDCTDSGSVRGFLLQEPTYESVLKFFLANYGTLDNYLRSYGGPVLAQAPDPDGLKKELGETGTVRI